MTEFETKVLDLLGQIAENTKRKTSGPRKAARYTDEFNTFWEAYPKKIGKGAAAQVWARTKTPPIEQVLRAINRQAQSEQWLRDNGQYIPNPTTWINQARWDDEVDTADEVSSGCGPADEDYLDGLGIFG